MQNGETAKVRYETAPKKGNLIYESPARLNHLKVCAIKNFRHLNDKKSSNDDTITKTSYKRPIYKILDSTKC